jgi:hypothetical protein
MGLPDYGAPVPRRYASSRRASIRFWIGGWVANRSATHPSFCSSALPVGSAMQRRAVLRLMDRVGSTAAATPPVATNRFQVNFTWTFFLSSGLSTWKNSAGLKLKVPATILDGNCSILTLYWATLSL